MSFGLNIYSSWKLGKYNMGSGMDKPGSWEGDFGKSFCYMTFYQDFQNSEILQFL